MNKYLLAALSLAVALAASPGVGAQGAGQGPPPPKPLPSGDELFEAGTLDGTTYTNRYFGITFDVPKGWTVFDPAMMRQLRERSKAMLESEKDENVKRQLEASVDRTTPLFSASRLPPGAVGSFNTALLFAAERAPTAIVKTPRDFYNVLLNSIKISQGLDAEVVEPFKPKRIGTADFGAYTLRLKSSLGVVMQRHLTAVKGAYVYDLVFTYVEESDAATFEEVVRSIKTR